MTGESEPLLEGTLISHLLELRTRLMRAFLAVILVFIPFAFYSNQLFEWLSHPLLQQLPANTMLISTRITATFTTPLKLSFVAVLVLAKPIDDTGGRAGRGAGSGTASIRRGSADSLNAAR